MGKLLIAIAVVASIPAVADAKTPLKDRLENLLNHEIKLLKMTQAGEIDNKTFKMQFALLNDKIQATQDKIENRASN